MTTPPSDDGEYIVGAFILMRHGDKQGSYDLPYAYTATDTELTLLGQIQCYELGSLIQAKYLLRSSTAAIEGLLPLTYNDQQSLIKADLGTEGSVITASVDAAVQGIWPIIPNMTNETLGDGSSVSGPIHGYQYVQVQTIDPNTELYLEGYLDCNTLTVVDNALYGQEPFLSTAQSSEAFLSSLKPYIGDRPNTYSDIYDIYDFMNVNYIHNITFRQMIEPPMMAQAQALANFNQWNTYGSPDTVEFQYWLPPRTRSATSDSKPVPHTVLDDSVNFF